MIKKTMLLAASACALVAFAVPAMAQASPHWEAEQAITDGTGALTSVSAAGLSTGPANVTFSGESTTATEGVIHDFVIDVPVGGIPTNVPSCFAVAATNSTTGGGEGREEEWPVTLGTSGTATHMTVHNVTFTNHYAGAGCAPAGVPSTVSVTGSATLVVVGGAGNTATANGVGDPLTVEAGGVHIADPKTGQSIPVNLTSSTSLTWVGPAVTP